MVGAAGDRTSDPYDVSLARKNPRPFDGAMADHLENARKFLESLHRNDLSKLLTHSEIEISINDFTGEYDVAVRSPRPFADAIAVLQPHDRRRIAEAALSDRSDSSRPDDIICRTLSGPAVTGLPALLPELIIHREMMIAVGTGKDSIQEVNDHYVARQTRLVEMCGAVSLKYQNPHKDLWDWFRHYKENFGTYAERRKYVRDLFAPAIEASSGRTFTLGAHREPTGWERVDRALAKARSQLDTASAEEEWQTVGLLCREVLISLAQAVYDPAVHVPEDGIAPSATDANRMLEAYIRHVFPGESYKEVRAHARAALALALHLQHRRTATRQLAALCLEAATSVTAVISIISGRAG